MHALDRAFRMSHLTWKSGEFRYEPEFWSSFRFRFTEFGIFKNTTLVPAQPEPDFQCIWYPAEYSGSFSGLVGPRRIGFYRNRISTGNQNHHSVSGSPEPDFLKIRFRSGRTGFQNLTGFRPDFIIWLDYYRISKFSRIPTGIQKFWQCLSLEGGKEWDVSWFIEVTLTHKRISIRSLGGGRQTMSYWSN